MGIRRRYPVACCHPAPALSTKRRKCPFPSAAVRDTRGGLHAPKQAKNTTLRRSRPSKQRELGLSLLCLASVQVFLTDLSFRVREFLVRFRRIDFFDHYLVVFEQA